ncbi:hypothetical protein PLANPX_2970 [Lacipirellula parvula]|uniref:DUF5666 domain-containing protein n=2 Tax=Lacipirellula parvula TaxID=2650471 RepID=A0A5K7X9Y9_9BACT|nr:hypothetical protein PLANPX_2970 [Lacipirellula parvula]
MPRQVRSIKTELVIFEVENNAMTRSNWMRSIGIGAVGLGIACAAQVWRASAEPARDSSSEGREASTISGVIAEFIENDHGDVDGVRLENGKQVHFPPHIGGEVTEVMKVGNEIAVRGHEETLPRGERVFAAENIAGGGVSIDVVPPRGPAPHARRNEPPMSATGIVSEISVNPHDDVDGFTLEDGTIVKFPPRQGSALADLIEMGSKVEVAGRRHETPDGAIHLRADRITATDSGKSVQRSEPRDRPLPPPHHAKPPHAGPNGHEGPNAGRLQEEILHELREIRRLLEEKSAR